MVRHLVLLLTFASATTLSAQTTIETTSFWDGGTAVSEFGKDNTATYGQTFTVPGSDNDLQSFSFFLGDLSAGNQLLFQGYVAEWDAGANRITGPLLYTSGVRSGPAVGTGFTRYDFDTGGLSLVSGGQYIAFLSASEHFGAIPVADATARWGYLNADEYAGGGFWFFNNGDDFSLLSSASWENFVGGGVDDLAFEMQFGEAGTVIPEPSTILLLGTGLVALAIGVRRRRT